MPARLSVNVNKIALLRNSRGHNQPNVVRVAKDLIEFGAEGITVHPRPDGRHIRREDVYALKEAIGVELNVEGYPSDDFMQLLLEVKPSQATLVPDLPDALTSSTGWDTRTHLAQLKEVCATLKSAGIRTSIFLNADPALAESAAQTGTDRVELYTGPYAEQYGRDPEFAILDYVRTANALHAVGLGINAGHDLNQENLGYFAHHLPHLLEVSIGHALVCESLYEGFETTIAKYLRALRKP
jgi:pyridoxine 5-phosphate synthase